MKEIWFDMDGTIADLYSVPHWLKSLESFDPAPYQIAKPLLNFSLLARLLNKLQRKGYKIGIVTWTSKNAPTNYNQAVEDAKRWWLKKHLPSVHFDEIIVTEYGVAKEITCSYSTGILFDDNAEIRKTWAGTAYDQNSIIAILKSLA